MRTKPQAGTDPSNGWEKGAATFIKESRLSRVGVAQVEAWTQQLARGSTVLDLGCGPGVPRSDPLHARCIVYAIDAAPTLARAYQERFPTARVACEAAEASPLFGRHFDGVLGWGLLFLLPPEAQQQVIERVASALHRGGRFLFTAPAQACSWADLTTGRQSLSLGAGRYRELLEAAGLSLESETEDEGQNHYYDASKS